MKQTQGRRYDEAKQTLVDTMAEHDRMLLRLNEAKIAAKRMEEVHTAIDEVEGAGFNTPGDRRHFDPEQIKPRLAALFKGK